MLNDSDIFSCVLSNRDWVFFFQFHGLELLFLYCWNK